MKKICAFLLAVILTVGSTAVFADTAELTENSAIKSESEVMPDEAAEPTTEPTAEPTPEPTAEPTSEPTAEPTSEPTAEPTSEPTAEPTPEPTAEPTAKPTTEPTVNPTAKPTVEPTKKPVTTPSTGSTAKASVATAKKASAVSSTTNAKILAHDTLMYATANINSKALARLKAGARVKYISSTPNFSKVSYAGKTGYIKSVRVERDRNDKDTVPAKTALFYTLRKTTSFTSTPASSPVIAKYPKGTVVRVLSRGSKYHTVLINSRLGYMPVANMFYGSAYVRVDKANIRSGPGSSYRTLKTLSKGTNVVLINSKSYGDWAKVKNGSAIGYIYMPTIARWSPSNVTKPYYKKAALPFNHIMYKSSSLTSKLKTYSKGQTFYIIATGTTRVKVLIGESVGYFKSTAFWKGSPATVTQRITMLEKETWDSKSITSLHEGANVTIISQSTSQWSKILYNGKYGYVLSCYLKRSNKSGEYTWKYVNGYKRCFDRKGTMLEDVSDLVSGPYIIKGFKPLNTVVIYAKDGSRGYTIPVKAMIASFGNPTPLGDYYIPGQYRWLQMVGDSYAQWCTQILGSYLFHSVPSRPWEKSNTALNVGYFNLLGTTQSLGCIRLMCDDAKWMYDNCRYSTYINITTSTSNPLKKPRAVKIPSWHTWDPSDPTAHYMCVNNKCH